MGHLPPVVRDSVTAPGSSPAPDAQTPASAVGREGALGERVARYLATWFGCGLSPRAPGTVGSLGAVPLHLLLSETPEAVHVVAALLLSAVGVWSAQRFALASGEADPQRVVIDEVAGTVIAMGMVRSMPLYVQCMALLLFRALDIWKPGPIRLLEHVQPPGLGIMLDDLLAGAMAGGLIWLYWSLGSS